MDRHADRVEQQIREAQERGEFDNLPGAGKPLPFVGKAHDADWFVKGLVERERLDMTAALPPQVQLRKEAQTLRERALREPTPEAARAVVEDFNARVRECWRRPTEGPPVVVRTVDVEDVLTQWRAEHAARSPRRRPRPEDAGPEPARTPRRSARERVQAVLRSRARRR